MKGLALASQVNQAKQPETFTKKSPASPASQILSGFYGTAG